MDRLPESRNGEFERKGYQRTGWGKNVAWYNGDRSHLHIPAGSSFDPRRFRRTKYITTDAQIRPVRPGQTRVLPTVEEIITLACRPRPAKFAPPESFPNSQLRKADADASKILTMLTKLRAAAFPSRFPLPLSLPETKRRVCSVPGQKC
jgi:hypothetical protein